MKLRIAVSTILAVFVISSNSAWAMLQVFPTRLFLLNQKRLGQLTLRHSGKSPETYKISAVFYRMDPGGQLTQVPDPKVEEHALLKQLRFSPREVTLSPGVEQVVRVMVVPNELVDGKEYRAHVQFEPQGTAESDADAPADKVAMKLSARLAVAVPVFYRLGNPDIKVTLSDLKMVQLEEQKPGFAATIQNDGSRFVYGEIKLWFTPVKGKTVQVGSISGVSSYVSKRQVRYPIASPDAIAGKKGVLKLDFHSTQEEGGALLASTEVEIR